MGENYIDEIDDLNLDNKAITQIKKIHKAMAYTSAPLAPKPLPDKVDLSKYLYFIRRQMGAGCWGYSMVAIWDIMNEMECPYSPNMSMRIWMMLHRRRELWEKQGGIFTPDGRFHKMTNPEWGFLQSFGNTTEGTEPTCHAFPSLWPDGGWSREGINEAHNYRLKSAPKKIKLNSVDFMNWLNKGHPIRLCVGAHFVAVVGYDKSSKIFKYVNSVGDNWGNHGYSTYTFKEIDNKQTGNTKIHSAEIVEIHPPKPVPAARISIKHSKRSSVHLWLSVEDSPLPKNKIWPHGWDDSCSNLCFTVRLPSEFIWPPSKNNRLVLELYDSGEFSSSGGELVKFTTAFGGHIVKCSELSKGPISFKAREHRQFCVP